MEQPRHEESKLPIDILYETGMQLEDDVATLRSLSETCKGLEQALRRFTYQVVTIGQGTQMANMNTKLCKYNLHSSVRTIKVHGLPRVNENAIYEIFEKCTNVRLYEFNGTAFNPAHGYPFHIPTLYTGAIQLTSCGDVENVIMPLVNLSTLRLRNCRSQKEGVIIDVEEFVGSFAPLFDPQGRSWKMNPSRLTRLDILVRGDVTPILVMTQNCKQLTDFIIRTEENGAIRGLERGDNVTEMQFNWSKPLSPDGEATILTAISLPRMKEIGFRTTGENLCKVAGMTRVSTRHGKRDRPVMRIKFMGKTKNVNDEVLNKIRKEDKGLSAMLMWLIVQS